MDEVAVTGAECAGITRWRHIFEALQGAIARGDLAAGARTPTEAALAAQFAVNRHTARRALGELSRAGLIRTEQGRGSFVAEDVLDYVVGARTRFSEWLRRQNREPVGRVLDLRAAAADPAAAAGLGLGLGDPVVVLERLGLADGRPVSLATHHFPPARLPGILAALGREATVTAALSCAGVSDYLRQSTRVTARMPSAREAALLETPRARPLLVCENINVDQAGRVVEFCLARHPTPRVQVVFEP